MNQPTGFVIATHLRPTYYYGRRHSYAYYPQAWTDAATGAAFAAGYYDENGRRYDSVTFEEDGRYKNVVCHCPYCDNESVLDLSAGDLEAQSLKCPHCGGNMEIKSELDTILSQGEEENVSSDPSGYTAAPAKKKKSRGYIWIAIALVIMALGIYRRLPRSQPAVEFSPIEYSEPQLDDVTITDPFPASEPEPLFTLGQPVYLEEQADGYHVVTDPLRAGKILEFDESADSYYDQDSDCWLWYNTDLYPAVWQYWYEGISSDFGDYGWMEHEDSGWYIQTGENEWIPLPGGYDSSRLWFIR